jgi:transcriptional regulator with XRE-family HTH domain
LIRSLRGHLGITQRELAALTGVTIGAVHQWESGKFKPNMKKKAVMVALRKLGRREVRKLLEEKSSGMVKKAVRSSRRKGKKKQNR